jgi:hypothetical protein
MLETCGNLRMMCLEEKRSNAFVYRLSTNAATHIFWSFHFIHTPNITNHRWSFAKTLKRKHDSSNIPTQKDAFSSSNTLHGSAITSTPSASATVDWLQFDSGRHQPHGRAAVGRCRHRLPTQSHRNRIGHRRPHYRGSHCLGGFWLQYHTQLFRGKARTLRHVWQQWHQLFPLYLLDGRHPSHQCHHFQCS